MGSGRDQNIQFILYQNNLLFVSDRRIFIAQFNLKSFIDDLLSYCEILIYLQYVF